MKERITLERWGERPAWYVRVGGRRVGVIWREWRRFHVMAESAVRPLRSSFLSREAAARGLARRAGFTDFDPRVIEERSAAERHGG